MNKNSIQMILALIVFVFIAAFAITFTYDKTADKINGYIQAAQDLSLKNVLSENSKTEIDSINGFGKYWKEIDSHGRVIGYAFIGSANGYSSKINFFCGIDSDGKIKGLSIISQNETPGLGTRVIEVASNARFPFGLWQKQEKTGTWFCEQYKGISVKNEISTDKNGEWHTLSEEAKENLLKNNRITTITGATITTVAVTNELSERAKRLIYLVNTAQEGGK